jgi:hypothetical protein
VACSPGEQRGELSNVCLLGVYSALGVARKALAGDGKEWGWKLDSAAIVVAQWQAEGGRDGGHTRGRLGGLK